MKKISQRPQQFLLLLKIITKILPDHIWWDSVINSRNKATFLNKGNELTKMRVNGGRTSRQHTLIHRTPQP